MYKCNETKTLFAYFSSSVVCLRLPLNYIPRFRHKVTPFSFLLDFSGLSLSSRLLEIKMSLAAFDRPHPGLGSARPPGARTRERRLAVVVAAAVDRRRGLPRAARPARRL